MLFASFTPMLAVFALPMLALSFMAPRWTTPVLAILSIAVFEPFVRLDDFAKPTGASCEDGTCTTVVMANLRLSPDAAARLAALPDARADFTVLVEVPWTTTQEELSALFGQSVLMLRPSAPRMGSRIAVLSRSDAVASVREHHPGLDHHPRSYVTLDMNPDAPVPDIIAAHAMWPRSPRAVEARDAYLDMIRENIGARDEFVLIGDFNMTPWEPAFAQLPGRRAGDPRWARTWNARGVESLTIDHALVGEGMEVVASDVLPDIGSDHYPIRVTVRPAR